MRVAEHYNHNCGSGSSRGTAASIEMEGLKVGRSPASPGFVDLDDAQPTVAMVDRVVVVSFPRVPSS